MAAAGGGANARKMARYAIRDLGWTDDDVLAALDRAIDDGDRQVRLAALAALARFGPACSTMISRSSPSGVFQVASFPGAISARPR